MKLTRSILIIFLFSSIAITSCKKNKGSDVSALQAINDSSLHIAREVYLWYNQIPSNFNSAGFDDPNQVMQGIRPYSRETGFDKPVDKWSFGVTRQDWENISSGISGDLGMGIFFNDETDLRVSFVEPLSTAGQNGVERSWQITAINGNQDINTSEASINMIIDAIYGTSPATIRFKKPDGSSTDIKLTPGTYTEKPILLDTVYSIGGKNIGYFVLNSFLGDILSIESSFAQIFARYQNLQVKEAVVDLRYNGGGYVDLEKELVNYMVPSASDGQVMSQMIYNDKYTSKNSSTKFSKKGPDLTKIVFIISKNTASASEAVINILKPHIEVKLVGPGNSAGKAVGFSGYNVGDWVLFPVSFRQVNSNNEGNYFNGMTPDKQVRDGLDKSWGDTNEDCLASALKYLTTGSFRLAPGVEMDTRRLGYYNLLRSPKTSIFLDTREPQVFKK
jgi:carboxyl-terminal processing protease